MKIRATLLVFVLIVTNFLSLAAPVNAIPREEVTTYHLHSDHLGSVRRITDENGKVIESRDYLPFGRQVATDPDGEPETTLGFTGHERDDHGSGAIDDWDYMHARYYSPWLGRFGSVDPVLGSMTAPQSWNRYSYAINNPLRFVDPTGMYDIDCGQASAKQCEKSAKQVAKQIVRLANSKGSRAQAAAAALGIQGDGNGVVITFVNKMKAAETAVTQAVGNAANNGLDIISTVTLVTGDRGDSLLITLGHEGTHVENGFAFWGSVDYATGIGNPALDLTQYADEFSAFLTTDEIVKEEIGTSLSFGGETLGAGVTPADRDLAIGRILADPSGLYGMTTSKPGGKFSGGP